MKKSQNRIFMGVAAIIMVGVGVWFYFYYEGKNYFTTDNAKVTTKLYTVYPEGVGGKLLKLNIDEKQAVTKDEIIAKLDTGELIKSPISGKVVQCDVVEDQVIQPTTAVAVIAATNNMYVEVNIEETTITKIKEGQQVTVQLDAYPGQEFHAHVDQIRQVTQTAISGAPTSLTTSGTYTKVIQLIPVRVVIDDPVDLSNLIGTNSTVTFKLR
ncbi:Multidrug resistance efflux pump [Candidatus Desulfosporosinus infrequens]|uniref:Multidrug resistance efflux pump n=1 Tax=Candidatus Desulfosporosinus infrequens TaxID=2043169 RepID=A0A2U3L7R9_9FIRM|nr:Multidrug resistance efflux pump [Candidatus Desulfosporosinus infrequens]